MAGSSAVRVLVADDNPVDRLVLSTIVQREGYAVVEAVDGRDAVEKFHQERPQMVLLDALMPGMDGFEVARRIKCAAGEAFVPIIFLTSLSEADALARALESGGDDFLSKPYNQIILKAKLNALQRMRAMHVTMQCQRDEIARHHAHLVQEQEAAKAVFDKVTHSGALAAPFIRHLISPLAIFNGDVLLASRNPAGDLCLLLGDFTGHGLTAAVGAMPLAEIFYGMCEKGFTAGEIVREANRKLGDILPKGYFCCATLLAVCFGRGVVEFWNGGLPPGCLFRPGSGELIHLKSSHLPLGIRSDEAFDAGTTVLEVEQGDRLIMCTDGIVEARNAAGQAFGFERFYGIVRQAGAAASGFEALRRAVYAHIGGRGRDDDITLVEITVPPPAEVTAGQGDSGAGAMKGAHEWRLSYELGPRSLRSSNPLPLLQQAIVEFPQLRRHAGAIYAVITELYSNALEHGLLGLDSALKSSATGFADYYAARRRGLVSVTGFVRFDLCCETDGGSGRLSIKVTDSGAGFNYERKLAEANAPGCDDQAYHGRGLKLLASLCQSVTYHGCGNEVEVVLAWSDDGA